MKCKPRYQYNMKRYKQNSISAAEFITSVNKNTCLFCNDSAINKQQYNGSADRCSEM